MIVCDDFEGKANVNAVAVEDFGEGFGTDFLDACGFEGDGGKFSAGAAAEVVSGFDLIVAKKVARADEVFEGVVGKVGGVVVGAAFGGDDVVGVDVVAEVEGIWHREVGFGSAQPTRACGQCPERSRRGVVGLAVVVILRRRWVLSTAVML